MPFAFLLRSFRALFAKIRSATSAPEAIRWTLMDSDTDDESNSARSTSVLRVAGLAALQQMLACVFLGKLAVKAKTILSRKNRMRAQRSSYATLQEQLLGLFFEPFANLSPLFRELLPAVFLHHASPCLHIVEHGFVDDPHMDMQGSKHFQTSCRRAHAVQAQERIRKALFSSCYSTQRAKYPIIKE